MQRPLLPILLAFMAGITAGAASPPPGFLLISAFAGSLIALLLSTLKRWRMLQYSSLWLVFFFVSFLNVSSDLHKIAGPSDISRYSSDARLHLEGIVCENPRVYPDRAELIVESTRILRGRSFTSVEGRVLLALRGPRNLPRYGDLIRFKARLTEPHNFENPGGFDYRRYLLLKGVRLRATPDKSGIVVIRSGAGNPLKCRLERYRNSLRQVIRRNASSPEGEIIQAMVLGEQSEIPREIMDTFNRTGTTHIIAISGFNIGIIAAFSFFAARLVMMRWEYLLLRFNISKVSALFAFLPVLLFVFISGFGVSVVRSALMVIAFLVALFFGREREPFNILFLAAILILAVSPLSLYDVSFQLSFVAVASLLFMVPVFSSLLFNEEMFRQSRYPRIRKLFASFGLFLATTISATLGAAPLIVYYFNLLSLITLIANILVVPIMGYLVILLGMVIIMTTPVSSLITVFLVKTASNLTSLSVSIADYLSRLPHAYVFLTTPTLPELAAYYGFLITGVLLLKGRKDKESPGPHGSRSRNLKIVLKMFFCFLLFYFALNGVYLCMKNRHPGLLRVAYIDVGQGSSSLIDFPGGTKMLIDGGGFYDGRFDLGRYVIAPFLWHERIRKVDIAVLTHPHPDHLNGLLFILRNFHVQEVWTNCDDEDSESFADFKQVLSEKGISRRVLRGISKTVEIGDARVDVLNLSSRLPSEAPSDANDRSLVLKIAYGNTSFLFPGDITESAERTLIARGCRLECDVLLAPHHGGRRSSHSAFLKRVRPKIAVFSCGAGNRFRFPHPEVLDRYRRLGIQAFRTDLHGAVTIETDGQSVIPAAFKGM